MWYVVVLTEKEAQPMKSMIKELWHGNIIPQEDSRNNSKEMKELIEISMNNCIPYRLTHPYRFLIIYLKCSIT